MELLEGEILRRRILESYSKNSRGWNFVVSPSLEYGFYDAVVSGPDNAWILKIDSIFKPFPTVLGSQAKEDLGLKLENPFPYGYRKLPPGLILQMLGGEGQTPRDRTLASLLSVLRSEPVVPEAGRSYAEGPFVLTSPGKLGLSESQREIGARLASDMRRLLKSRYPAYG
jgi:hypothetical protein